MPSKNIGHLEPASDRGYCPERGIEFTRFYRRATGELVDIRYYQHGTEIMVDCCWLSDANIPAIH